MALFRHPTIVYQAVAAKLEQAQALKECYRCGDYLPSAQLLAEPTAECQYYPA